MSKNMTNTYKFLDIHPLPPEAQIAAISSQHNDAIAAMLHTAYRNSVGIPDAVFDALLDRKLDSETATDLALHCDTSSRVEALLAVEKRATVIARMISSTTTQLSAEQLKKLASPKVTKAVAEALAGYLDSHPEAELDETSRLRIMRSGGHSKSFLSGLLRSSLTDAEVFKLLSEDPKWLSKLRKFDLAMLEDMLTIRPGLLHMFCSGEAHFTFKYAASGSHMLTSQQLQDAIVKHPGAAEAGRVFFWSMSRLAWNPRCTAQTMANIGDVVGHLRDRAGLDATRALEAVSDAQRSDRFAKAGLTPLSEITSDEAISFFLRRNTGRFARNADGELLALLRNPNLSGEQLAEVCLYLIGTELPVVEELWAVFEARVADVDSVQAYSKERVRKFVADEREKDNSQRARSSQVCFTPRDYSNAHKPLSDATVADLLTHYAASPFNPQAEITGLSVDAWILLFLLLDDSSWEQELEPLVLAAAATC